MVESFDDDAHAQRLHREVDARRAILRARFGMDAARESKDARAIALAEAELRAAVLDAIEGGISWQTIGDVLGVRRGAAYQRFRRRPDTREQGLSQPPL